jgi:hypothetical protein
MDSRRELLKEVISKFCDITKEQKENSEDSLTSWESSCANGLVGLSSIYYFLFLSDLIWTVGSRIRSK